MKKQTTIDCRKKDILTKILKKILILVPILLVCYVLGYLLNMFVSNGFVFEFTITDELLFGSKTLLYTFEFFAICGLLFILAWYKGAFKNHKKLMEAKKDDNEIYAGLEQAHFQTDKEIAENFTTVEYQKLPMTDIEGIPVKAVETNKGYQITFTKPAHTLILGTTGSGKTTTYINPVVQILSNTKNKPSMLLSDPKGELYSLHAKSLIKRGYDVKVLDLRNPYCSIRWNPLERPYKMYQEMLSLEDKVYTNEEEGYYVFEDKIYYDLDEKNAAVQVRKQEIFDEVYEDLNDICSVLCPVTNKSEPIWESGAKNFILAITLAMLEDSEDPKLGMTQEKFNFFNIMKIATNTQNDCEDLIEYFNHRSPISKSVSLSKQVLDASDKTRGSYLSTIFDKLSMFSDMSICSLTSANEINFADIEKKPTALFLQIPDEKETRHTLAAMVILQAYKDLVARANTYPDLALSRSVYFLLDEFGNLPPVHKLDKMITVGRSRRIWLSLVVQSYAQLAKVYDEKLADIIKSNCNIEIFIGTTDLKTIKEFSDKCGNYSVVQRNVSFSSGNDNVGNSMNVKERPLIYPSELSQLNSPGNMGNAIVRVFGFPPIKSKYTPSYKSKYFVLEKTRQLLSAGKYFNEEKVFYNMLERNKSFAETKPQEDNKNVVEMLVKDLQIQIEKFDFESLSAFENKLELLSAIENKNYMLIYKTLKKVEEIAKSMESEDVDKIKEMCNCAENIMRKSR